MSVRIDGHSWRYASRPYPAPDGIDFKVATSGHQGIHEEHSGRLFYHMDEGFLYAIDPANGGHPVWKLERGLIRGIDIQAL